MKLIAEIFSIPLIARTAVWVVSYTVSPSLDKIDQGGQLIAQAATPWWVSVVQFLEPLGVLGAIGIIVLLVFVTRNG